MADTKTVEPKARDYGPGRTQLLGLAYGSDAAGNFNWDKIDALLGKLAGDAGLLPPPEVPPDPTELPPPPEAGGN